MEDPPKAKPVVNEVLSSESADPPLAPMGLTVVAFLALYLMFLGLSLVYGLVVLWPHPTPSFEAFPTSSPSPTPTPVAIVISSGSPSPPVATPSQSVSSSSSSVDARHGPQIITFFNMTFRLWDETRLLLLVMFSGAIGAYLRSTISLATHAERGRLPHPSWILWCILQTYIGMLLATIFFFVLRGATVSPQTSFAELNIFATLGIASLVGLFSPQATDKLRTFFSAVAVGEQRNVKRNKRRTIAESDNEEE